MIGSRDLPRELAEPRVIVYHKCPVSATGSILGPHDALAYWWADSTGIRVVPSGPLDTGGRARLETAVRDHLGLALQGDAIRRRQDELAESDL